MVKKVKETLDETIKRNLTDYCLRGICSIFLKTLS